MLLHLLVKGNIQLSAPIIDKLQVMLIDETTDRRESMSSILEQVGCEVVACISTNYDLLQKIERYQPHVVIIDIDLPDRDILENLRNVQTITPKPMIMFSQDDDGMTIRRAVEAGVSAYIVDDLKAERVRPIMDAAIATFDQYQLLQKQLDVTRLELDKRNKLERAKSILMKQHCIDEERAYKSIRKSAMDQKQRIEKIAQKIIDADDLLNALN